VASAAQQQQHAPSEEGEGEGQDQADHGAWQEDLRPVGVAQDAPAHGRGGHGHEPAGHHRAARPPRRAVGDPLPAPRVVGQPRLGAGAAAPAQGRGQRLEAAAPRRDGVDGPLHALAS
jgi:hypothetical protein